MMKSVKIKKDQQLLVFFFMLLRIDFFMSFAQVFISKNKPKKPSKLVKKTIKMICYIYIIMLKYNIYYAPDYVKLN